MIKQQTVLEVIKEHRSYQLSCESSSPLGELHDVLTEMKSFVIDRIKQAELQQPCEGKCPTQEN